MKVARSSWWRARIFSARFGGQPMNVQIPPAAVLGIYARENGRGMLFAEEEPEPESLEQGMQAAALRVTERGKGLL